MARLILLILPVLLPSWRFFQDVGAGLRVEMRVAHGEWREVFPRAKRITPVQGLGKLVWNPSRNEALFLATCAERYLVERQEATRRPLVERIAWHANGAPFAFRIVLVDGAGPVVAYESSLHEL